MNTENPNSSNPQKPLALIFSIINAEKRNIKFLYVYAVFSGLISLTIPLGIQTMIGYVMAGRLNTSWFFLSVLITLCVLLAGLTRLAQLSIIDSIQRKLFIRFSMIFKEKILSFKNVVSETITQRTSYFMDIVTLQKSLSKLLIDFTGKLLQAVFGLLLLAVYHPFFLIFGIIVTLVVYLVLKYTWKRGFETSRCESNFKFKTYNTITKMAHAGNKEVYIDQIDEYVNEYAKSRNAHFGILYRQAWLGILTKVLFTAFMLVIGSFLLVEQRISLGQFLASEILIITLLDAIEKLILTVENLYDCGVSIEKLNLISETDD
jgi:ABC-type bacteriocin/lantibiotic exporter with double-glycine peptidase domain